MSSRNWLRRSPGRIPSPHLGHAAGPGHPVPLVSDKVARPYLHVVLEGAVITRACPPLFWARPGCWA